MITPLEQLETQISRSDSQLLFHIATQLVENNRLLRILVEGKPVADLPEKINEVKRPELMKQMSKTNPPKGWQKWSNDKMIEYLKGESI